MGCQSTRSLRPSARLDTSPGSRDVGEAARDSEREKTRPEGRGRCRAVPGHDDEHERPERDVERAPAGLRGDGERRCQGVGDDADGERSEQERLQSPHAILPSPPATVSASA